MKAFEKMSITEKTPSPSSKIKQKIVSRTKIGLKLPVEMWLLKIFRPKFLAEVKFSAVIKVRLSKIFNFESIVWNLPWKLKKNVIFDQRTNKLFWFFQDKTSFPKASSRWWTSNLRMHLINLFQDYHKSSLTRDFTWNESIFTSHLFGNFTVMLE